MPSIEKKDRRSWFDWGLKSGKTDLEEPFNSMNIGFTLVVVAYALFKHLLSRMLPGAKAKSIEGKLFLLKVY